MHDLVYWLSLATKLVLTAGIVVTASIVVERAGPQAIDAQFGHPGDEELTEIDADQGQDAKGYAQPVSLEQRQDQG